jgi:hypothetical protein
VKPGVRVPILLFLGTLLLQAAWVLVVPGFRGVDEFDHAYRAASVARGEWVSSYRPAPDGRGELVRVPRDIVAAAGPECRTREYTEHDNCAPVGDAPGDPVEVATAASRYHPAFYWLVGTPARAFDGTAALYAMRVSSAVICSLFVALAGWVISLWARGPWPMAALLVAFKPIVAYSGSLPAPNGVEIVAALSVWTALTGLAAGAATGPQRSQRWLLLAAVPGAITLATVRSLGVMWLAACLATFLALVGWTTARELVSRHPRTVAASALPVTAGVVGAVLWITGAGPNRLEEHADNPGAFIGSLIQVPVWVLQSIATGIGRSDPAPVAVYLLCGTVISAFLWSGVRAADSRARLVMLLVAGLSVAGPFILSLLTYRDVGVVWQGRYGLPFSVGLIVLAGLALDRGPVVTRTAQRLLLVGVAVYAVGHVLDVTAVLRDQRLKSPSVALGLWNPPSAWLVAAITILGWALLATAVLGRRPTGSGAAGLVTVDELAGQLLEEQPDVRDDATGL